jgi:hypothetical protein
MANDAEEPAGDQSVFRLNCNQSAEAAPKHEDRREAKNAAGRVKENTEPAHPFAAEGQEINPVRIGGQIGVEDAEDAKSGDYPTIGPILPNSRADMALAEQRRQSERDRNKADRDQRRIGKEPRNASCAGDRQPQIGDDAQNCSCGHSRRRHGPSLPAEPESASA